MKPIAVLLLALSFLKAEALTLNTDHALRIKSSHLGLQSRISSTLFTSPVNQIFFSENELANAESLMIIGTDEEDKKYFLNIFHKTGSRTKAHIFCPRSNSIDSVVCGIKNNRTHVISSKPIFMDLRKTTKINIEIVD